MGKAQKQKETPAQKALADHAMLQLRDYKQRWLPVQQHLAKSIEDEGAAGSVQRRMAAGRSSTDVAMAFDKAQGATEKGLSSGRSALGVTGMADDAAKATGLGALMSDQAIDDAYTQGLGALTKIGRGEAATVGNSLGVQAQNSAAQARADAEASAMNREGNAQLGAQVAGFGLQQGLSQLPNMTGSAFSAYDTSGYGMTNATNSRDLVTRGGA